MSYFIFFYLNIILLMSQLNLKLPFHYSGFSDLLNEKVWVVGQLTNQADLGKLASYPEQVLVINMHLERKGPILGFGHGLDVKLIV